MATHNRQNDHIATDGLIEGDRHITKRIQKPEIAQRLAERMNADAETATAWLNAVTDTLYEASRMGENITLPGFGGFYVRPERDSWVFRFNPAQCLRAALSWSSTYKGDG